MAEPELVRVTERAAGKIRDFLTQAGAGDRPVRLSVVRTHCMGGQGHGYDLRVAKSPAADDQLVASNGVTMFVDPKSAALLRGTQLDYVESLEDTGFVFTNPNATGKCPCGHHDLFG